MKMPRRELKLLVATLAIALLAGTYVFLEPSVQEFGEYGKRRAAIEERKLLAQRLLDSRPQVEQQVQEFLEGLPSYPEGKKPDSTLMPALENLAGDLLTRREIGEEEPSASVRNLYETAITCHWEGTLPRLVDFLYDQQSQGSRATCASCRSRPSAPPAAARRRRAAFPEDFPSTTPIAAP